MNDFGELNDYLEIALRACNSAKREIIEVYESDDFGVESKEDESPLTRADKRSHRTIVDMLSTRFPHVPVLSEEGADIPFEERSSWNRFWLVDPLDGTKEFVKRNGEFTINIALIEKHAPILGVVCVPVTGVTYFASKNHGSYVAADISKYLADGRCDKIPIELDPIEGRRIRVVASRSHFTEESRAFVERIERQYGKVSLVNAGSALKLCLVAEGKADVYPRYAPTMEWDTAAGHVVAAEAGCTVLQAKTEIPLEYNKHELVNPWFVVSRIGVIS